MSFRTRCSPIGGKEIGTGLHPNELWGVATRDMSKPRRNRGEQARARRRAKRAAKRQGVTLKSYLRGEEQRRQKEKSK